MNLTTFLDKIRDALQSPMCLRCGKPPNRDTPFCQACHTRLGIRPPEGIPHGPHCRIHTATVFNPDVKRLVYGYKFYGGSYAAHLAGILIQYWLAGSTVGTGPILPPEQVLVLPVPPHEGRPPLVGRFASRFARHFGYDYREDTLAWIRDVSPQHRIVERKARFANMSGGLQLRKTPGPHRRILIVDDISTTGATLMEAARAMAAEPNASEPDTTPEILGLAVMRVPSVARSSGAII